MIFEIPAINSGGEQFIYDLRVNIPNIQQMRMKGKMAGDVPFDIAVTGWDVKFHPTLKGGMVLSAVINGANMVTKRGFSILADWNPMKKSCVIKGSIDCQDFDCEVNSIEELIKTVKAHFTTKEGGKSNE